MVQIKQLTTLTTESLGDAMTKQSSSLTEVKSIEPGAINEQLMTRLEPIILLFYLLCYAMLQSVQCS